MRIRHLSWIVISVLLFSVLTLGHSSSAANEPESSYTLTDSILTNQAINQDAFDPSSTSAARK